MNWNPFVFNNIMTNKKASLQFTVKVHWHN